MGAQIVRLLKTSARTASIAAILSVGAFAQHACNSHTVGQFWPEAANGNRALTQEFFRSGELEICTRISTWRYHWQKLSVTLDQLKAKHTRNHAKSNDSAIRDTAESQSTDKLTEAVISDPS